MLRQGAAQLSPARVALGAVRVHEQERAVELRREHVQLRPAAAQLARRSARRVCEPQGDIPRDLRDEAGPRELGLVAQRREPSAELDRAPGRVERHQIARSRSQVRIGRSEEHTSELQSLAYLVCRLLLEKKKKKYNC